MGGGLMQLVAYGAQDIYLTGNPQITFFKVVYRRHTNFAMESIQQSFNGSVAAGTRVSCVVSRNGDLVHRMLLEATVGGSAANVDSGHAMIKSAEVEIGGQRVDKQYGEWMSVWSSLTLESGKTTGYNTMVGREDLLDASSNRLYVPLQFWFCRNPGCALPLIALQYHEVRVNIEFGTLNHETGGAASLDSASLYVDYIYLDTDERRRFAQVSHEYLIEQLQFTGAETLSSGGKVRLNFNHPVKELVWCVTATDGTLAAIGSSSATYQLKLNGHDRFAARDWRYFSRTQVHAHHSGAGGLTAADESDGAFSDGVGVYSFALKPEEHQPSGTCNFSRIDNAQLVQSSDGTATMVYAVNYNVLRVMSGMGGLAYSN